MNRNDYQLSFELSPIVLVGGVAGTGMLPIISILSAQDYKQGVTSSATPKPAADYFGQFRVLPNHTLMDNEVATYPAANQITAANAVITNPLTVSFEMLVPANGDVSLSEKLAKMTSLKSKLDQHTSMGGYYNLATPSFIYQGALLRRLVDATEEDEGGQVQVRWVWDFVVAQITASAVQAAQNQAMANIANQTKNSGDPPGSNPIATGVGQPSSNIVQNLVPAAAGPAASNVAPGTTTSGQVSVRSVSPISPGG